MFLNVHIYLLKFCINAEVMNRILLKCSHNREVSVSTPLREVTKLINHSHTHLYKSLLYEAQTKYSVNMSFK